MYFPEIQKKIQKSFFGWEIIAFELVAWNIRFYWENILVIGSQYGKKESQDIRHFQKSLYGANFLWELSINLTKTLLCRFKQWFRPFNMLTVHKSSDTGFFGLLSNSAFPVYNFSKKWPVRPNFFLKVFKILCKFWKCRKNPKNVFWLWHNRIWIGCVKHLLLLREYTCYRVSIW